MVGGLVAPLAASAQFAPNIPYFTAGIPYIVGGFGNAYGAPASSNTMGSSMMGNAMMGYGSAVGGYGMTGFGGYGMGNVGYGNGMPFGQYYPVGYSYAPYYGNFNQPYLPNVQVMPQGGSLWGGLGQVGYSNYSNYGNLSGWYY